MGTNETVGNIKADIAGGEKHPLEEVDSFEEHMKKDIEGRRRKTVEEKAKEKGYHKNKDGIWVEHKDYGFNERADFWGPDSGEGFDKPVEWFKLDEEYPDLADKTEELAEKYNVVYKDDAIGGLKEYVYKNASNLEKASDEHLENLFNIAGGVSLVMGDIKELLVGYDSDKLKAICNLLESYYTTVMELMPDHKLDRCIAGIGEHLVRGYNAKLVEGDFLESLSKYSAEAFLDESKKYILVNGIKTGIRGISKNEDSGRAFGSYMAYFDKLVESDDKITEYDTKSQVLSNYVAHHGAKPDTAKGFEDVIFPLMEQRDDEVIAIIEGGNAYGTDTGEYGVADYAEECLLSSHNPREIDKLIRIYHEIPTSDYRKFEQNRKDASRLQDTIIGARDFIHDEKPGVNEVLVAIRDYYENRDNDNIINCRIRLAELEDKYHFGILPYAFNLEAYEKPIERMSWHNRAEEENPNETAIEILNRLIENTRPNLLEAPKTKNEELNRLMENIAPDVNKQTGEVLVNFDKVGAAVTKMNEILLQNKGKQGVYPSTISAIAFLDKMSAQALRNADKKDLQELPFDPGFKEIVRFSQLTSSMEYNENDFENKYRQIVDKFSEAYGDDGIDSSKVSEGYRILNQQILKNMQELSKNYASKSVTARFGEAVWSGNLSDELIGLFDRV